MQDEGERHTTYRSETETDLTRLLDHLADRLKPAGAGTVTKAEVHFDAATGLFVSLYTTLKTTRSMLTTNR